MKSSFYTAFISKLYQTWDESQQRDKNDQNNEAIRAITDKSNGNNWVADISIQFQIHKLLNINSFSQLWLIDDLNPNDKNYLLFLYKFSLFNWQLKIYAKML